MTQLRDHRQTRLRKTTHTFKPSCSEQKSFLDTLHEVRVSCPSTLVSFNDGLFIIYFLAFYYSLLSWGRDGTC